MAGREHASSHVSFVHVGITYRLQSDPILIWMFNYDHHYDLYNIDSPINMGHSVYKEIDCFSFVGQEIIESKKSFYSNIYRYI